MGGKSLASRPTIGHLRPATIEFYRKLYLPLIVTDGDEDPDELPDDDASDHDNESDEGAMSDDVSTLIDSDDGHEGSSGDDTVADYNAADHESVSDEENTKTCLSTCYSQVSNIPYRLLGGNPALTGVVTLDKKALKAKRERERYRDDPEWREKRLRMQKSNRAKRELKAKAQEFGMTYDELVAILDAPKAIGSLDGTASPQLAIAPSPEPVRGAVQPGLDSLSGNFHEFFKVDHCESSFVDMLDEASQELDLEESKKTIPAQEFPARGLINPTSDGAILQAFDDLALQPGGINVAAETPVQPVQDPRVAAKQAFNHRRAAKQRHRIATDPAFAQARRESSRRAQRKRRAAIRAANQQASAV